MSDGDHGGGDHGGDHGHGMGDHDFTDGIDHHAFDAHMGEHHGHGPDGHGSHGDFHGFSHGWQSDVVAAILGDTYHGGHHGHGHGMGLHEFHGHGVSGEVCRGRRVLLPGIATAPRTVQLLQWPHGVYNPKDTAAAKCRANPRAKLCSILKELGLVDVGFSVRDVAPSDEVQDRLMDTTPFDDRVGNTPMGAGWYEGATGHTRLWKDFYMVGKKPLIGPRYPDKALLETGVYLAIAGATWYYDQSMDFETRIALSVKCRVKYNPDVPEWAGIKPLADQHRELAEKAARLLLEWFKCFPVDEGSCRLRQVIMDRPQPEVGRVIPPPHTVPRELFKPANGVGGVAGDGIDAQSFPE